MGPQADFFVRWRHVRSPGLKADTPGRTLSSLIRYPASRSETWDMSVICICHEPIAIRIIGRRQCSGGGSIRQQSRIIELVHRLIPSALAHPQNDP